MLSFNRLSETERRLAKLAWQWNDDGRPSSSTPELKGRSLDGLIAKLWVLESRYHTAVIDVETVLDSIEKVESPSGVEESEQEKEQLHIGIAKLKEVLEMLEWLRTEHTKRTFGKL